MLYSFFIFKYIERGKKKTIFFKSSFLNLKWSRHCASLNSSTFLILFYWMLVFSIGWYNSTPHETTTSIACSMELPDLNNLQLKWMLVIKTKGRNWNNTWIIGGIVFRTTTNWKKIVSRTRDTHLYRLASYLGLPNHWIYVCLSRLPGVFGH